MVKDFSKHAVYSANLLLVVVFTVSLFWCGDAECLAGSSHDNCASLICSLLNNHDTSTQDTSNSSTKNCSCVCHTLTVTGKITTFSYYPPVHQTHIESFHYTPSSPPHIIDHPPLAS